MEESRKQQLIQEAKDQLSRAQASIQKSTEELHHALLHKDEELAESEEIRMLQSALTVHNLQRLEQLHGLHPSPYFTRCDVSFENDPAKKTVYIGKFPYEEGDIISWTAPAAALRFEDAGPAKYRLPDASYQKGVLHRKDQYMITNGQIIFFASEDESHPRELIYQEYLSNRASGFALPEIVAQMEKAQDEVIRAEARGPLVISGPAGSGKTTLALHRVAYLTQSPDTAKRFPGHTILVFVQDNGTKQYFTHLLPQLGIHHVRIATFSEWALERLELPDHQFEVRIGHSEEERDEYEYAKIQALKHFSPTYLKPGKEYDYLARAYGNHLSHDQQTLLNQQRTSLTLDRLDITVLLMGLWQANPGFATTKEFSVRLKDGRTKREFRQVPLRYSLIVVDEFQNYLPQQLKILQHCMNQKLASVLYVGDMAQQTAFGTIRRWEDIGESVADKIVRLQKVYRNTRQILEFIRTQGYDIEIPDGIKEGPAVTETTVKSNEEIIAFISQLHGRLPQARIGLLARHATDLEVYRQEFHDIELVHPMSMRESQGVEFDAVIILKNQFEEAEALHLSSEEFKEEQARISRDLNYVALTRAISELHILKLA